MRCHHIRLPLLAPGRHLIHVHKCSSSYECNTLPSQVAVLAFSSGTARQSPNVTSIPAMAQLHGLNAGFALDLGELGESAGLAGLDLTQFARLKKLHLIGFNSARASELGWQLVLPRSLRVLYLDGLENESFVVSPHRYFHTNPLSLI